MKNILGFLALVVVMCSCGTAMQRKSLLIESGMTKENVVKIMGAPGNRQFDGREEVWQYCATGLISDKYYVIWFYDSLVTGLTQYTEDNSPNTSNGYKRIDWLNAPPPPMYIRHRE